MTVSRQDIELRPAVDERYRRNMLIALLLVTMARLWWLAAGHTDLYPDEAQYWLWSQHPAFGYYSKPPMVAWLIALTTGLAGNSEFGVRLAAPLLHFATALLVYEIGARLYDGRVGAWSAIAYATLPGVTVSSMVISTDAPLLLAWAVALYGFLRAREPGGQRWWLVTGIALGLGLLAKYAMIYWLISALLFLLIRRDERRHLAPFGAAVLIGLVIYSPNFIWNLAHGFVSYHHTEDNAALTGLMLHPLELSRFFVSQFGVFGPIFFAALILLLLFGWRRLKGAREILLLSFTLPTLVLILAESLLSRAEPNWAAPAYVAAVVLVVAWLLSLGRWRFLVAASVALHIVAAVILIELRPLATAMGYELPAKYDLLHRLRGWRRLGAAVGRQLVLDPGAVLLADDREDMAALLYYVEPRPTAALKWNGEGGVHDQFDLTADPAALVGRNFLLVSRSPDVSRILARFSGAGSIEHITIPIGGGMARSYTMRLLTGFKGYH